LNILPNVFQKVFANLGMDYHEVVKRIIANGEPGFSWLQNAQQYSRMIDPPDFKDYRAKGGNPCLEQTLESMELCCLVETFPTNHEDIADFLETLKYAFLYAKTVTLGTTHWPESNAVMLRNRRIGTSMSGIAQFISRRGKLVAIFEMVWTQSNTLLYLPKDLMISRHGVRLDINKYNL
jgi:ribonucleoside-triphosphate reductase (thioredoxin)